MANQIQGTVYQINTIRQVEPIVMSFSTQNIIVREATIAGIPEVLSCIIYYQSPGNSPTEYYVSEFFINLFDEANAGEVALINTVTMPDQLAFAFPTQNISIVGINGGVEGANSCIQYRGNNYYVAQTEEELYAQANTNNALPYKVYTALLTQSGGDDLQSISSGSLIKGLTYNLNVDVIDPNWDFSNVGGFVSPNTGTFVATESAEPLLWGNAVLTYNTGAPVVTVLENTIGNVWFTYDNVGNYSAKSNGLFSVDKTWFTITANWLVGDSFGMPELLFNDTDSVNIYTLDTNQAGADGALSKTPIEIRVYN